jgi:hypothetical protein
VSFLSSTRVMLTAVFCISLTSISFLQVNDTFLRYIWVLSSVPRRALVFWVVSWARSGQVSAFWYEVECYLMLVSHQDRMRALFQCLFLLSYGNRSTWMFLFLGQH